MTTPASEPGRFSAEEIVEAYASLHVKVQTFVATHNWNGFADFFTEDAVYVEHAFGTFRGREQIRAWSTKTMTTFPGGIMTGFPLAWQIVDVPTSRLVCEVRNLMPDPGDGHVLEESNITIVTYAGDGLFSREEDVYNPLRFLRMSVRWAKIAEGTATSSEEGRAYLAQFAG